MMNFSSCVTTYTFSEDDINNLIVLNKFVDRATYHVEDVGKVTEDHFPFLLRFCRCLQERVLVAIARFIYITNQKFRLIKTGKNKYNQIPATTSLFLEVNVKEDTFRGVTHCLTSS